PSADDGRDGDRRRLTTAEAASPSDSPSDPPLGSARRPASDRLAGLDLGDALDETLRRRIERLPDHRRETQQGGAPPRAEGYQAARQDDVAGGHQQADLRPREE